MANASHYLHTDFIDMDDGFTALFGSKILDNPQLAHFGSDSLQAEQDQHEEIVKLIERDSDSTTLQYTNRGKRTRLSGFKTIVEQGRVEALVHQSIKNNSHYRVVVAATTPAAVKRLLKKYADRIPPEVPVQEEGKVSVNFWYMNVSGPSCIIRDLDVPKWDEIRHNYSTKSLRGLDSLMHKDFRPVGAGQFILWSGEPGTGKTTALRSMSQEWREWCDIHYITDPEQFFGNAGYLMSFLQMAARQNQNPYSGYPDEDYEESSSDEEERWMLIILEDTGELLSTTAKLETGQGLSRFLNVVDGFLGQGLKIIVLITTNEDFKSMHPAVTRPGRCRADIKFRNLDRDEIEEWCEKNNVEDIPDERELTLADLYGILTEQIKGEEGTKQIGFANAA